MRSIALVSCFGIMTAGLALGQNEVNKFTFDIGAGFTTPIGNTGRALDVGWNGGIGAGVNFNSYFSTLLQFQFNQTGINSSTLNSFGTPDGSMQMWSLTLDPTVHLTHKYPVDVYLVGGGGLYHRHHEFTTPTTAVVTGFDPFFGFFPISVPANQVVAEYSVYKPGWNGGMGVSFGGFRKAKFFAEARYHRMFISNGPDTQMVPVTFGLRW